MSVRLEGVSKIVGRETHLADVSLAFERGTLNVVLGPTLSGKTSLLRVLAGLDVPTAGRLWVDGVDVTGVDVRKRSVAMVYQQFINYPNLTVFENIASPLRVRGAGRDEIEKKVRAAAATLRLDHLLDRTPLELSGGQQQRCAIARAIVKGADLVLLDEPLANLDYKLREELREELPRIFAESGAVFVYATTEPSEALLLGGSTAAMSEGRLVQFGPTLDLYRRPIDLLAARTFSDPPLNVMTVEKEGDSVRLPTGAPVAAVGMLAKAPDGTLQIGVRAHDLTLAGISEEPIRLVGTAEVTEITGSESYLHFHAGPLHWVALLPGVHEIAPGAPVAVRIDPRRLFVFDAEGRLVAAPDAGPSSDLID